TVPCIVGNKTTPPASPQTLQRLPPKANASARSNAACFRIQRNSDKPAWRWKRNACAMKLPEHQFSLDTHWIERKDLMITHAFALGKAMPRIKSVFCAV